MPPKATVRHDWPTNKLLAKRIVQQSAFLNTVMGRDLQYGVEGVDELFEQRKRFSTYHSRLQCVL